MGRNHVTHSDIAQFAVDKVNLPKEYADDYRGQVNRLREKLENYLDQHKDFSLKKILLSGSLAKGTALRSLNDIDLACYISGADAPKDIKALLDYLAERLRTAFPNFKADQVKPQTYSVTVTFAVSGLNVDVVPILYDGDPKWYGNLVSQDDGSFLKTSIPLHLDFLRKRKQKYDKHFAQVIRLAKFWAKNEKASRANFRFKSFMIELIMCRLADDGYEFSDYPEALQNFFTYLAKTDLKEIIAFSDYYPKSALGNFSERVRIIDPVNEKNNAAKLYNSSNAEAIVAAAVDAGDAIDAALAAPTKELTVYYWQKVFGTSFKV